MWAPTVGGCGSSRYASERGGTGGACRVGLAIRGRELVIYRIADGKEQTALLSKLGKHKMGKSCLYFKRLADLDTSVLERLIVNSLGELEQRYG